MKLPEYIIEILETLNHAGFEAYVVGGCVRDFLLGKQPHDYDICTNALPEDTIQLFKKTILTGMKHGTITVLSKEPVEITTFRVEKEYIDHRHPSQVVFVRNLEDDLSRRDFTINAMAFHPKTGIIDLFHGQEDLKKGLIRCVGNANTRFDEDALRMLRAHRFCAKLHFQLEEKTKQAIFDNKDLLQYISVERIRSELVQIMEDNPYELENMTELLSYWMPELKMCKECDQNSKWHDTNVLHHSLRALKLLPVFDETLAWVLLMHDFGKPATKSTKNGFDHFYGHPVVSAQLAKSLCKKFKLTSYQQKVIPKLIEYHDSDIKPDLRTVYRFRIKYGLNEEMMEQLLTIKYCDIMAHSVEGQKTIETWKAFKEFYQECKKTRPMSIKDLAINGQDVMEHTKYRGSGIREYLDMYLVECFYHPEKNSKEYWLARMQRK